MTTHKEALMLALDALENHTAIKHPQQIHYRDKAITAIKEALAQPEQEPVARVVKQGATVKLEWVNADSAHNAKVGNLYTTPPQRTWVGLTEEEVEACFHYVDEAGIGLFDFADAIEDKLKEKNT